MLFFKGKEDMGLESSLKLLDLPPDATIDDANQAYAYLHRMVELFHQDAGAGEGGGRQEDMELLSCAYEKAVAYLSDQHPQNEPSGENAQFRPPAGDGAQSTDIHFTINFSADGEEDAHGAGKDVSPLPETDSRIVEDAISIISRRLHRTESELTEVRQSMESAEAATEAANRQLETAKQARMDATVAAKSAKARALLLEIEAKRAMEEAIAVAEKARDRVVAARKAAREAGEEADRAREQAIRVRKSEETAAAEAVCAEDRLEKAKDRLKDLTHTLVETRSRMKMFSDTTAAVETPADGSFIRPAATGDDSARQQIMSDLLEIEASLHNRKRDPEAATAGRTVLPETAGRTAERRRHNRVIYPLDRRPQLCIDGRTMSIFDLSTAGMRLEPDAAMARSRIVRGVIDFDGRPPVTVTGKVVRQDDSGMGLRLVTRIGDHILERERLRLSA